MCGQQRNSPMADPIFGSKYGPQNGVQNWITFSFLLLGLCLGPVLGSRFGPKSGVSHRRILLLPAEVLQADLRRTSMSVSVNTCFFSLCVPLCFLYSTSPTSMACSLTVTSHLAISLKGNGRPNFRRAACCSDVHEGSDCSFRCHSPHSKIS